MFVLLPLLLLLLLLLLQVGAICAAVEQLAAACAACCLCFFCCCLLFLLFLFYVLLLLLCATFGSATFEKPPLPLLTFQNAQKNFTIDWPPFDIARIQEPIGVWGDSPRIEPGREVARFLGRRAFCVKTTESWQIAQFRPGRVVDPLQDPSPCWQDTCMEQSRPQAGGM